jgi:hypothetical protein
MGLILVHPRCGVITVANYLLTGITWQTPRNGVQRAFVDVRSGMPIALFDISMYNWLERTLDNDARLCNGHMVAKWLEQQVREYNERKLLSI